MGVHGLKIQEGGLLPNELIKDALYGYPTELVFYLRERLASEFPRLREKLNAKRCYRYLGYANGQTDALYVYVQKRLLRIDIKLPQVRVAELRQCGFQVLPVKNFQWKAGWITGWRVPNDTIKRGTIVAFAIEALTG